MFRTADDLATQRGVLVSPQTFHTLLKPVDNEYFSLVKSGTDAKTFYPSCGNVVDLLDDVMGIGVDIINPVHNSQPDVSPRNFVAMAEATCEFGAYSLAA